MTEVFRRRETKYELNDAERDQLRSVVVRHLPLFEFRHGRPFTFISTVYFDTAAFDFFARARKFYDDSVKLRIKEYYYCPEMLSEPETYPFCYVEIKERIAGQVQKRRLKIHKKLVNSLLRREDVWDRIVSADPGIEFQDSTYDVYSYIAGFLAVHEVEPQGIINYRRIVFQENEHELRVTFDDQLQVFRAPTGLYNAVPSLTPANLGSPIKDIPKIIMEIKCRDGYPGWLDNALGTHYPQRISKFTTSIDFLRAHLEENGVSSRTAVGKGGNGVEPSHPPRSRLSGRSASPRRGVETRTSGEVDLDS